MGEWTPTSWWNGRVSNGYTSCGTCVGKTDYSFDENNPEICYCAQQAKNNDGEVTTTSKVDRRNFDDSPHGKRGYDMY